MKTKTSCPTVSCSGENSENFCYDSGSAPQQWRWRKSVWGYVSVAEFTGLVD